MISREDLESFLIRTEMDHREIGEAMWLVDSGRGGEGPQTAIVVSFSPPLVVFRTSVGEAPKETEPRLKLFERLLELNATELVHGAYGLEDDEIILTDALEIQDLDYSEFLASLEALSLAIASHREQLGLD